MSEYQYSRFEKSLGLLTTRFVSLLQNCKDGVLDIKIAADLLAVRQKRRIYDITNVLEGIGLIEKKSKNSIQWTGAAKASNDKETSGKLLTLKKEIAALEEHEKLLDLHRKWIRRSLSNVMDDRSNRELAYVTSEDIADCYQGDQLLILKAPLGSFVSVKKPYNHVNQTVVKKTNDKVRKKTYELSIKSVEEPIDIMLVPSLDEAERSKRLRLDSEGTQNNNNKKLKTDPAEAEENTTTSPDFIHVNSPLSSNDYFFCLTDSEGLCELFDISTDETGSSIKLDTTSED